MALGSAQEGNRTVLGERICRLATSEHGAARSM